jgi:ATP-dependent DNA helicase RecQ
MSAIHSVLAKYWGYSSFRHPQEEIIQTILAGRDVFAMMPTGGGKSLCYQVPALVFEGITIVVSPLIALIEDQVQHLKKLNIPVGYIHSGMDKVEQQNNLDALANGATKLFYLSPERLQSSSFMEEIANLPIDFLAIDEAHCISQWGHDFRPAYRVINQFKD